VHGGGVLGRGDIQDGRRRFLGNVWKQLNEPVLLHAVDPGPSPTGPALRPFQAIRSTVISATGSSTSQP
jgi:hypothetical protein